MWQLNNLFAATPVHPGELLSVAAFRQLDSIRDRARRIVEADRKELAAFLDRQTAVSAVRTPFGTTAFLRLHKGNVEAFLDRLRAQYETSAVPGRFFGAPDHFRIGMGVDSAMFAEGLRRLNRALDEQH
jgi:aspartate/methionine/tyrosine aminotransferase